MSYKRLHSIVFIPIAIAIPFGLHFGPRSYCSRYAAPLSVEARPGHAPVLIGPTQTIAVWLVLFVPRHYNRSLEQNTLQTTRDSLIEDHEPGPTGHQPYC